MDTIQIKLSIFNGGNLTQNEVMNLRAFINQIQSPFGYRYCDYLDQRKDGSIGVKISYPRYWGNSNAFLIRSNIQTREVNKHFCESLKNHFLLRNSYISLERVDIPFTYYMENSFDFNSHSNIYKILGEVHKKKKPKGVQKTYGELLSNKHETIIYSDTKTLSGYNSKVMIYNQYQNLLSKTPDGDEVEVLLNNFEDLKGRIRIEASKRIRRNCFTNFEFSTFDILAEYLPSFKKEVFTNFLNFKIIDQIYEEKKCLLINLLKEQKALGNFNYEVIILRNASHIYDYEILRRAFNIFIENKKTRESAVTRVRKILNKYSEKENIIVMDIYSILEDIAECVEKYYIIDYTFGWL